MHNFFVNSTLKQTDFPRFVFAVSIFCILINEYSSRIQIFFVFYPSFITVSWGLAAFFCLLGLVNYMTGSQAGGIFQPSSLLKFGCFF